MNKQEARIIHGLYFHREMVGESIPYSANEIAWLAQVKIPETRNWQKADGKLHSVENKSDDYLASVGATSAAAQRPLRYLHETGFIQYQTEHGQLRISVTAAGADIARELDTWYGRANLLYKNHKEGLLWFLATVLVSLITSYIATGSG